MTYKKNEDGVYEIRIEKTDKNVERGNERAEILYNHSDNEKEIKKLRKIYIPKKK